MSAMPADQRTAPTLADARRSLTGARAARTTAPAAVPPSIRPAPRTGRLPLSLHQEQQWFLNRWDPDRPLYNAAITVRLRGALDAEALRRAVAAVVARHEILRTRYDDEDGEPYQIVDPPPAAADLVPPVADGTDPDRLARLVDDVAGAPFDLCRGPVLRAAVIRTGQAEHVLVLALHHIAFDGASLRILTAELFAAYAGRPLPPLPIQYADYAVWQRTDGAGAIQRQLDYWRDRLRELPVLDLPTDRPRPATPSQHGATRGRIVPATLAEALTRLARTARVTPLTVYLAGFTALLARYSGQTDIAVGSVFSGRTRPETEPLIGYFAQPLVLRTSTAGDPTFRQLLAGTHEAVLGAHLHQDLPFTTIVRELAPHRDTGRNPLFDVCFTVHHAIAERVEVGGLGVEPYERPQRYTQFDLTVELTEVVGEGLRLWAEYSTDLFDTERIDRLLDDFVRLLTAVAGDPDARLSAVEVMSPAETRRLLAAARPQPAPPAPPMAPAGQRLHELFEQHVDVAPGAPAIRLADGTLTYADVEARANRLAHALRAHGAGPERAVAVQLDTGSDLPVALLGVLKSGAVYLPLDPAHPPARRAELLRQADCNLMVAAAPAEGPDDQVTVVPVEQADRPATRPPAVGDPRNLAYVLFTSGSTGRPKAVLVEHRSAMTFMRGIPAPLRPVPDDRVLLFTSPTFDVSVYEIFAALGTGASLVAAPRRRLLDPRELGRLMREHRVSVLLSTPAILALLDGQELADLRKLSIGGEAFGMDLVARWSAPGRVIHNGYGPAETTIEATNARLDTTDPWATPPIGRPRVGYAAYLLDPRGRPVPLGAPGELHIAGAGVARGYLGRPGLTADRFRPDPFGPPGSRRYRTGDLARQRGDLTLEFLGRVDQQLKLRGHRVEPGEIEAVLTEHPAVAQAAVVARPAHDGDRDLVAFVTAAPSHVPDPAGLRAYLAERLPRYMIPNRIVELAALPLTTSGKIDRRALVAMATPAAGRADAVDPVPRQSTDTAAPVPVGTLMERFEAQVAATPDSVAVAVERREVTFAALNRLANRIAHRLIARGLGPDDVVAMLLPKSAEAITCLFGVLKAGAAALPIDPGQPADRVAGLLADARPDLVISESGTDAAPTGLTYAALAADGNDVPTADPVDADRRRPLTAGCAAYVLYTSGSTGRPKGVTVQHGNLVNLFAAHTAGVMRADAATGRRRVCLAAPLSFDASWAGLLWLVAGNTLHLLDGRVRRDAAAFVAYLRRHRVDVIDVTPTHCKHLLDAGLLEADTDGGHRLAVLILGGEAIDDALWQRLRWAASAAGTLVVNVYGPTECTVDTVACDLADTAEPAIGRPMANTRAYVLDERLRPMPPGAPGELYLAGAQVSRGYRHRPAGTAERFVADPFGPPGTRMYRTGDRAAWRADGRLDFRGRTDGQVKVRGHRIEPGEIEAVLREHDGVGDAAVVVREDRPGQPVLVAYVTRPPGALGRAAPDAEAVRAYAERRLPGYMVPGAFVPIERMPLTANNKLDRAALPAPGTGGPTHRPPATALERDLCALVAEVLDVPRVGLDDSFFALGGHSLLATKLVSRIRSDLGIELPLRRVFDTPRVGALAELLADASAGVRPEAVPPLRPAARPERVPLSYAQTRLWLIAEMDGPTASYNLPAALRLHGHVDTDALQAALDDVVARHESLRTVFDAEDGQPYQRILDPAGARVTLRRVPADETDLLGRLAEAAGVPFDLRRDLPVRAWLFTLRADEHVLLLVMHHIATDGWSMGRLGRDVVAAYRARAAGAVPSWPALPVQYADYSLWQRAVLGGEDDPGSRLHRQLAYWRERLDGAPAELAVPADRPRPARSSGRGGAVEAHVDAELVRRLERLAQDRSATLFMVLYAGLAATYTRVGAGTDIVVGSPIAGRTDAALHDLVGFFVNTFVLRVDTAGRPSFAELLDRVRAVALGAYAHQDVPFERLVELLNPPRSLAAHPLFQTMLVLDNNADAPLNVPGLSARGQRVGVDTAKFDLLFTFTPAADGGLDLAVQYSTDLFEPGTARGLAERYLRLLAAAADDPGRGIDRLELLTSAERQAVLRGWSGASMPGPAPQAPALPTERLSRAARAAPDAPAVRHREVTLTYRELDRRSNRLARRLIAHGAGPERIVALAVPRSVDLIVALCATVKAGAAFMPIDPSDPPRRIAALVADAAPALILTASAVPLAGQAVVDLEDLEDLEENDAEVTDADRWAPLHPDHPAYVLYTSGSTGTPKGVVMPARALANLLDWQAAALPGGPGVRTAQFTAPTFDVAAQEVLGALGTGSCLDIVDDDVRRDPEALAGWLHEHAVGELFAPNLVVQALAEALGGGGDTSLSASLTDVVQAGEALVLSAALRRLHGPHRRLHNHYGPTETHVVTAHRLDDEPAGWPASAPIGRPLPNVRVYLLDEALQPVPPGVPGELYVAGEQLARGYLHRAAHTAERFVADPFGPPGSRLYRTGDRARWRADGTLEYLGRLDAQVKLRGLRIEPGEIEAVLQEQPGIAQAAVLVRDDRLTAYLVPEPGGELPDDLPNRLAEVLPRQLIPTAYQRLAELPLTRNGKLDRRALPAAAPPAARTAQPRTPTERLLCGTVADLLGLAEVGPDDNFFHLGGHSLLAARLAARLRVALNADVPLRLVFEQPTMAELAAALDGLTRRRGAAPRPVPRDRPLPLSFAQQRLWFLEQLGSAADAYHMPCALRLTGELDVAALQRAVDDLVERHEVLRTVIVVADGEPYQRVLPPDAVTMTTADLSGLAVAERDRALARLRQDSATRPFDLAAEPPARWLLVRLAADEHLLLITLHHVAGDGWSFGLVLRELAAAYGGTPPPCPPIQYADFAAWQRAEWRADGYDGSLRYWQRQLAHPPVLAIPADVARPEVQTFRGDRITATLAVEPVERLRRVARAGDATLFMAVLAGFDVLLYRLSGQTDIVVGSPVSGRSLPELERLIGCFLNVVALRADLGGSPPFTRLLADVRETTVAALAHQDVPFERVVDAVGAPRDLSRHPLYQVMVNLIDAGPNTLPAPGLTIEAEAAPDTPAKLDLTLYVREDRAGGLAFELVYNADLFSAAHAERMLRQYLWLLDLVGREPDRPIDEYPMLGTGEGDGLPDPDRPLPTGAESSVPELIAEQARRTPDAEALVDDCGTVTYERMDRAAGRLAGRLRHDGVRAGDVVALYGNRSAVLVCAMLGVLRAGAAFLLLDPADPPARGRRVLAAARCAALVTLEPATVEAPDGCHAVPLPADPDGWDDTYEDRAPREWPDPWTPAYVAVTSGTTGEPKLVLGSHAPLTHFAAWQTAEWALTGADRWSALSGLGHDPFLRETLVPLTVGGTVCLPAEDVRRAPRDLAAWLARQRVTVLHAAPALARLIAEAAAPGGLPRLRRVFFGGDTLTAAHVVAMRATAPAAACVNFYGTTETPQVAGFHRVTAADGHRIPVGTGIPGVQLLVVDAAGRPAGIGEVGEVWVRTPYLSDGYRNDAARTAERFRPDPAGGARCRRYRTGDLGVWTADGTVTVLGRADEQVSVRGFRVEPAEVAAHLTALTCVRDAVVVASGSPADALAGYVVAADPADPPASAELRRLLRERLPGYLVPAVITVLERLPVTSRGKLDLPLLRSGRLARPAAVALDNVPPRGATEELIGGIWRDVLGAARIGRHDSFFDLGGDSLRIVRVHTRLEEQLGRSVPILWLFQYPTVATLADALAGGGPSVGAAAGRRRGAIRREAQRRRRNGDPT
ncbi:amino acid adenylation domain-containing protein [Micromonospora sp. NPDC048999]|uniref:amino acid adenylation domain-containing protein n=1 Tax=Micromonospora sp. NPDC048999 TaxID=3155391 RepID=UPI0033F18056